MEHQELLNRFAAACRNLGLKLTHQRLEIYSELVTATDHPSAEILHRRLKKRIPTISLDTVYRTLFTFKEHGLIQKIETVESQARFEVRHEQHHHLICKQCDEIMDFHWPSIDTAPLPEEMGAWGRIESKNIVVYGICNKCLTKK
jgi:Fur family transcriptional regulator, peroxide stress response regulator